MSLDAISTTDPFETFTKTLCAGYDHVALTSLVAAGIPVVPWLLTPSMASLEDLLSLFSNLSKAHLGYLHWVRAFLRCSFSCLSKIPKFPKFPLLTLGYTFHAPAGSEHA